MQGVKINGCDISSFNRISKKCRKCQYKQYCSSKEISPAYTRSEEIKGLEIIEALGQALSNTMITANEAREAFERVRKIQSNQRS